MNNTLCLVVTFNRLSLLKELISALANQTFREFDIWVIDNGSTDGTRAWLESQKDIKSFFHENNGPGASFAFALEIGVKNGYNNFWLMDDDGLPDHKCIEFLIHSKAFKSRNCIVGSVVIDKNDYNKLSFLVPKIKSYLPFLDYHTERTDSVDYISEKAGEFGYPWGMFFNSILIPVEGISKFGYPRKDFFIWGDEVEYFFRARKSGYSCYLIPESKFYHPSGITTNTPRWKKKFEIRNYVAIDRMYRKWFFVKIVITFLRIIFKNRFYLLSPFIHGLTNNFTHNYLYEEINKGKTKDSIFDH